MLLIKVLHYHIAMYRLIFFLNKEWHFYSSNLILSSHTSCYFRNVMNNCSNDSKLLFTLESGIHTHTQKGKKKKEWYHIQWYSKIAMHVSNFMLLFLPPTPSRPPPPSSQPDKSPALLAGCNSTEFPDAMPNPCGILYIKQCCPPLKNSFCS